MNQQILVNQIIRRLSYFVTLIKGANSVQLLDINSHSENVLIPIFKEVFEYNNLKNLNLSEKSNYPAIDLGDETARVACQVTSNADTFKVKETLTRFVRYELHKKFDKRVFIYILTEKQRSYSQRSFDAIIQNRFHFDAKQDIIDYRNLIGFISSCSLEKIQRVASLLEKQFQPFSNDKGSKLKLFERFNANLNQLQNICDELAVIKSAMKKLSPEQANYYRFLEKYKTEIDKRMPGLHERRNELQNLKGESEVLYQDKNVSKTTTEILQIIENAFYRLPSQPMDDTEDVVAAPPKIAKLVIEVKNAISDELQ